MKALFTLLACSLFLNTAYAQQPPNYVADAKAALLAAGQDLSGACGAFKITARVAYQLRPKYRFLIKQGGNRAIVASDGSCKNGDNPGPGYATDYLIDTATGYGYDILGDGGGANNPQELHTAQPETDDAMVARNKANSDAPFAWAGVTDDLTPPTPPVVEDKSITTRLDAIEAFDAVVVAKYNELITALNQLEAIAASHAAALQSLAADVAAVRDRTTALEARQTVSSCVAKANLGAFSIPISCKLQ